MKKICLFLFIGLFAFAMTACSDGGGGGGDDSSLSLALRFNGSSGRAAAARALSDGSSVTIVISGGYAKTVSTTISDGSAVATVSGVPVGSSVNVSVAAVDGSDVYCGSYSGYTVKSGDNTVSITMVQPSMTITQDGSVASSFASYDVGILMALGTTIGCSVSPVLPGATYTWRFVDDSGPSYTPSSSSSVSFGADQLYDLVGSGTFTGTGTCTFRLGSLTGSCSKTIHVSSNP